MHVYMCSWGYLLYMVRDVMECLMGCSVFYCDK